VSGGESSGAGIEVPSVSEKLMGASVNGLNLAGIAAVIGGVPFSSLTRMSCAWSEVIARRERQEEVSERCRIADGRELREGRGEGVRQGLWDGARTVVCTTRGVGQQQPRVYEQCDCVALGE
jgi:hypothetical protein